MAIESNCSGCGKTLSVAEEHAGKQARCPACGQIYTVPYPAQLSEPGAPNPALAETVASDSSAGSTGDSLAAESGSPSNSLADDNDQFWMRATDGADYGPVIRTDLMRWFTEGRVGVGYQIRQGENGPWQPADVFRPVVQTTNPYSEVSGQEAPQAQAVPTQTFVRSDQSGIILTMGILGFVLCPIFGLIAWIMGSSALKDIQAGRADPRSKDMVQVGYYLGMASMLLALLTMGGGIVLFAIGMVA